MKAYTILMALVLPLGAACGPETGDDDPDGGTGSSRDAGYQGTPATNILVRTVLDGDTIIVKANAAIRTPDGMPLDGERIRLLGIDAPEIEHPPAAADCWGPEAEAFLVGRIQGRLVTIEYDPTHCRPGSLDKCRGDFGRLLGYVKLGEAVVNREILQNGHARVLGGSRFRHRDSDLYDTLESQARSSNAGLWGNCR